MNLTSLFEVLQNFAINAVVAIVLFIVGWYLSSLLGRLLERILLRAERVDNTVVPMLKTGATWGLRCIVLVIVLTQFGVRTASLIAVLGAAGLAIGLALQGTLQNIASGIMLLCVRPMNNGDSVIINDKITGTVLEISLFLTRIQQSDGVQVTMPNSTVWNATIINLSRNGERRMDIPVAIRYGEDLPKAMVVLQTLASDYPRVLSNREFSCFVSDYRDSNVVITLRVWTLADDFSDVQSDLMRDILVALTAEGFTAPIPVFEQLLMPAPKTTPQAKLAEQVASSN